MTRRLALLAAAFAVCACGDPSDQAGAAGAPHDSVAAAAPAPPADPREPAQVPDSLEAANVQLMRERQASMARYTECVAQGRGVPEQARRQIEQACSRLPDAPK